MWLVILKWFCFLVVCTDVIGYIIETANKSKKKSGAAKLGKFIGFSMGIAARVFVLYGTLTCWVLV